MTPKTISTEKFLTLPRGFQESIHERSIIHAAVHNCNIYLKDLKDCRKWAKGHEVEDRIIDGRLHSLNHVYENQLLPAQKLADKYYELWGEKYYRTKLEVERELNN